MNDTVNNVEDLSAKLGELGKSRTFAILRELDQNKSLRTTKVETLLPPRLFAVAAKSFPTLSLDDTYLVLVRAEGDVGGEKGVFDFVVAIRPPRTLGREIRVVGFGED